MRTEHFPFSNNVLQLAMHMPGAVKSTLVWIGDRCKMHEPFSAGLLRHYLQGAGKPFELSEIGPVPEEWQKWIVNETKGIIGKYHLNPYNSKPLIIDLKNSLGHFDVVVSGKLGSTKKAYDLEKAQYHFGFKPHDRSLTGQHGFELQGWTTHDVEVARYFLPTQKFNNPGGFSEEFEIRQVHLHWMLFIPQEIASRSGTPFRVHGRFER